MKKECVLKALGDSWVKIKNAEWDGKGKVMVVEMALTSSDGKEHQKVYLDIANGYTRNSIAANFLCAAEMIGKPFTVEEFRKKCIGLVLYACFIIFNDKEGEECFDFLNFFSLEEHEGIVYGWNYARHYKLDESWRTIVE